MTDLYPVTIVLDRYKGIYSGGKWIAWNLEPDALPEVPFKDDTGCATFWANPHPLAGIGRGCTPQDALDDLHDRIMDTGNLTFRMPRMRA